MPGAASLEVTNRAAGFNETNLYTEALANGVECDAENTTITVTWPTNYFSDSVAILSCNFVHGHLTVETEDGPAYSCEFVKNAAHTIIHLPRVFMIKKLIVDLIAFDNISIGLLYVGARLELPLFNTGFSYEIEINGKSDRTRYGIAYGLKQPSLRSFSVKFSLIDNATRAIFENYIENVQFVKPHLVELFDPDVFDPLYATLKEAGGFDKEANARWLWNTSLGYTEAR